MSPSFARVFATIVVLAQSAAAFTVPHFVLVTERAQGCDTGDARLSQPGDFLTIHYTGYIDDSSPVGKPGKKFDSTRDRTEGPHGSHIGMPFTFQLGKNEVIMGWEEGLLDMCVGEKRILKLPPELGYGEKGADAWGIPGGAWLKFEVECWDILDTKHTEHAQEVIAHREAMQEPNIFADMDVDKSLTLTKQEIKDYYVNFHGVNRDADIEGLLAADDKNGDGTLSWEEFSGPKGTNPHDEL